MIIGNLMGIFRRLCFCFNVLAPLYILNASNGAGSDPVGKLYRSAHVEKLEGLPPPAFDKSERVNLKKFCDHAWPSVVTYEDSGKVTAELGNRMLFNNQIVESGNVFNHMDKYMDKEAIFKLENRYSVLNAVLGDELAKFYIKVYNGKVADYSSDELGNLSKLYAVKLSELNGGAVINSIFL